MWLSVVASSMSLPEVLDIGRTVAVGVITLFSVYIALMVGKQRAEAENCLMKAIASIDEKREARLNEVRRELNREINGSLDKLTRSVDNLSARMSVVEVNLGEIRALMPLMVEHIKIEREKEKR